MHSKAKLKQEIGALERSNGFRTSDEPEIAELLNNFFSSVFINENLLVVPSLESKESFLHLFMYIWICLEAGAILIHLNLVVLMIAILM